MNWRTAPQAIPETEIEEIYNAEIVVVGLGYAGSAAFRAATEAGASVIGIEAQSEEKYTLFGRDVGHINSAFLASRGIAWVDPGELFEEWMRRAGNRANPGLVRKFCEKSGEAFDWYTDMFGLDGLRDVHVAYCPNGGKNFRAAIETGENTLNGYRFWYGAAEFPDPMGWPGSPTLPACAMANLKKAEAAGGRMFFGIRAEQLVQTDGRVTDVIAKDALGRYCRIHAETAVILAAGDFSRNEAMVRELCPDIDDLLVPKNRAAAMGRRGDGIRMGIWAGGRLEARPLPTMGGNGLILMGMCNFGAVWFDQNGNRFCNEIFGGPEIAGFAPNQDGIREVFAVFDEHAAEHELTWAVPAHGGFDVNVEGVSENLRDLTEYAYAGGAQPYERKMKMPLGTQRAYYGRTPEELAQNAGITGAVAENLCHSIRRYNEMAEAGADCDYGRDSRTLDPLTGMLFLQRMQTERPGAIMVTVGGLVTNVEQQVLDADYAPIPGLYATGNCCGRRFGLQYSTPIAGVSIGMAITLGREAGRNAADKEK